MVMKAVCLVVWELRPCFRTTCLRGGCAGNQLSLTTGVNARKALGALAMTALAHGSPHATRYGSRTRSATLKCDRERAHTKQTRTPQVWR